jgi:predicted lipoprotein with Yx(FWY)xxD motif
MRIFTGLAAVSALVLSAGAAFATPPGVTVKEGAFVAPDGKPLYTFAKDMPGMSHCDGGCAKAWPPLAAAADAKADGDWTVVARSDGSKMWAYKGAPLYTFAKDTAGQPATGVSANWPLAKQ